MFRRSRRAVADTELELTEELTAHTGEPAEAHAFDDEPLPDYEPTDDSPAGVVAVYANDALPSRPAMFVPPAIVTEPVAASTVIGPSTVIEGTVRTHDDLRVEGSISGALEVGGVLIVERGASVDAQVQARSVRVSGRLHGEIRCEERLHVLRGGRADGQFSMATLMIEEGAVVSGRFSMSAPAGGPVVETNGEPAFEDIPEDAGEPAYEGVEEAVQS